MSNAAEATSNAAKATPGRLLGLDVGEKRIGVALTDGLGLMAQPLLTLYRGNPRDDLRSLRRLLRKHGCTAVVVGNPLHLSGEPSNQARKVQGFAKLLGEMSGLPIVAWDERLTSAEAHRLLYEAGRPRSEHRAVVDQVAAVLILQGYLDAQRDAGRRDVGQGEAGGDRKDAGDGGDREAGGDAGDGNNGNEAPAPESL